MKVKRKELPMRILGLTKSQNETAIATILFGFGLATLVVGYLGGGGAALLFLSGILVFFAYGGVIYLVLMLVNLVVIVRQRFALGKNGWRGEKVRADTIVRGGCLGPEFAFTGRVIEADGTEVQIPERVWASRDVAAKLESGNTVLLVLFRGYVNGRYILNSVPP